MVRQIEIKRYGTQIDRQLEMKSKQLVGFQDGERKLKRTIQITGKTHKKLNIELQLKNLPLYQSLLFLSTEKVSKTEKRLQIKLINQMFKKFLRYFYSLLSKQSMLS